jgi:hypothetical protein
VGAAPPAAAPDTAGIASAFAAAATAAATPLAADDGQVFHSLFRTGERRQPIDPMVNQLWSPQVAAASAPSSGSPTPEAAASADAARGNAIALGLFQTQPANARTLFDRGAAP